MTTSRPRLYLAGPDVFAPDADARGRRMKALADAQGFEALYPLDTAIAPQETPKATSMAIFRANIAAMRQADAALANVTPFRGPNMDPGTAFEIGFMHALGKPVIAYTDDTRVHADRVETTQDQPLTRHGNILVDKDGWTVEDFGLIENLMIDCAVRADGLHIVHGFERALSQARALFGRR